MPCPQRRRIPLIIRAVSPCFTPPCVARRRERSRPPIPPPPPRNHHFASDTSTHLTPPPRKFPLPVRCAESVTVRRAMPTDHHEALPSLLYLCGGLRLGRFMWCLHSVSCRSFFFITLSGSFLHAPSSVIVLQVASIASQIRIIRRNYR